MKQASEWAKEISTRLGVSPDRLESTVALIQAEAREVALEEACNACLREQAVRGIPPTEDEWDGFTAFEICAAAMRQLKTVEPSPLRDAETRR